MNDRRPFKVAIVAAHPTQFEVPLYRYLSSQPDLEIAVFYWRTSAAVPVDPELGHPPGWDFPLFQGYASRRVRPGTAGLVDLWSSVLNSQPRFDLVILPGWPSRFEKLVLILALVRRAPIIIASDSTSLYSRNVVRAWVRRALIRFVSKRSRGFLAKGTLAVNHLDELGIDPSQIFLFPYSIDDEALSAACEAWRARKDEVLAELQIAPVPVTVLVVVKFVPREGVLDVVAAADSILSKRSDISFVLVGDGPLRDEVESLTNLHPGRIALAGYRPYSELPKFYACADVFVHPAHEEPWGLSVNEAAACSLPVITSSAVGAAYDLVEQGVNGYVYEVGDVADLAKALSDLADKSTDERQKMGRESRERVARFGFGLNCEELRRALRQATES